MERVGLRLEFYRDLSGSSSGPVFHGAAESRDGAFIVKSIPQQGQQVACANLAAPGTEFYKAIISYGLFLTVTDVEHYPVRAGLNADPGAVAVFRLEAPSDVTRARALVRGFRSEAWTVTVAAGDITQVPFTKAALNDSPR